MRIATAVCRCSDARILQMPVRFCFWSRTLHSSFLVIPGYSRFASTLVYLGFVKLNPKP